MASSKICDVCGEHGLCVAMEQPRLEPPPQIDPDAEDPARELLKMSAHAMRGMVPATTEWHPPGLVLPMGWAALVLAPGVAEGRPQRQFDLCGPCRREVEKALKPKVRSGNG